MLQVDVNDLAIGKEVRNAYGQNLDRICILFNTANGFIKNAKSLLLEILEKKGLSLGKLQNYQICQDDLYCITVKTVDGM